jgi:hypothetical protein
VDNGEVVSLPLDARCIRLTHPPPPHAIQRRRLAAFEICDYPQQRGFGTLVSRLHLGGATAAKATPNPKEIICRLDAISAALGEIQYTAEQAQMGGAA